MMELLNTKAELAVPLHIGEQVAGVLDVHGNQANVLTQQDLFVVQSLGAQLSVVLENARLYDELELRVQKRTEELGDALRQQALEADKTKAIVESISDAVIVFDPLGYVSLANPGTTRVLGIEPEHWQNCNLDGTRMPDLAPQDQEMMQTVFQVVRSARQSLTAEQDLVNTVFEAVDRVIASSLASVALREQEPLNVVAVFRDVTQEAQLNRMKSEFIAMAAHELRTPMTSIKGYISLLSAGVTGAVNEKQQEFLQVINSNVNRLMTLVNDLLDISKIEDEGLRLNFEPVLLADVVAEVTVAMQKQIEAKEQLLDIDVSTKLPEVVADRDRMIQVVINLLSNAHKYTPRNGKLAINGRQANGYLVLDFCDSGIGISPQDQEHLFTRFFRAENAMNTQESGTGLGLAICYEIIERHGGEIQVESELGKGSTFRILMPLPAVTEI
jgi:PAS domain S-box-containing protein